jgi:hypothetical protein
MGLVIVAHHWPPREVAGDLSPNGLRDHNYARVKLGRYAVAFIVGGT